MTQEHHFKDSSLVGMDMFDRAALERVKNYLMQSALDDPEDCPCCGQRVQIYRRRVSSAMARQLIISYRRFNFDWFHIESFARPVTDWGILAHFGLIEPRRHNPGDEGKKSSGFWRITPEGKSFIELTLSVPEYALIYNQKKIGYGGGRIGIIEALGKKFDYRELMNMKIIF